MAVRQQPGRSAGVDVEQLGDGLPLQQRHQVVAADEVKDALPPQPQQDRQRQVIPGQPTATGISRDSRSIMWVRAHLNKDDRLAVPGVPTADFEPIT